VLAAEESQDERHSRHERVASGFRIRIPTRGTPFERRQHVQRLSRAAAGGQHAHVGIGRVSRHLRFANSPRLQCGAPLCRKLRGARRHTRRVAAFRRFDPRLELDGVEAPKREQEIRQVALHVNHDRRHVGARRFLDQHRDEPGFAAAGHAHHDGMRHQMLGG
jgi:hypothetical protein